MREPRILVVDDDETVLVSLERLLSANGLAIEIFLHPDELLASVQPDDVGCVITDLEMPAMSGAELQADLKSKASSLAVIVISGHADVRRAIHVMGQGAVTLLEKPFEPEELLAHVERAIAISRKNRIRREAIEHARALLARLNEDELEIMRMAAKGLPNKAIVNNLALSPRTVDRRRKSALEKLQIESIADFAVLEAKASEEL